MEFDPFSHDSQPRRDPAAGQNQPPQPSSKEETFDAFNTVPQNQAQVNIQNAQQGIQQKHQETPTTTKSIVRARPHAKTMPANTDLFSFQRFGDGDRSTTDKADTPDTNAGGVIDVFATTNTNSNDPFASFGPANDNAFAFAKSNSNTSTDSSESDNANVFNPFATPNNTSPFASNINDPFSPPNSITSKVFITSNQQQPTNTSVGSNFSGDNRLTPQSSFDDTFLPASNSSNQNQFQTSNGNSSTTVRNDQNQTVQASTDGDRVADSSTSSAVNPQEIIANLAKSGFISETRSTLKQTGSSNSLLGNDNLQQRQGLAKAIYKFIPRHEDEVLLDVGDAIEILERYPDLWCRGKNTRTNKKGLFPICCVAVDANKQKIKNCIRYLGSVATREYKGSEVIRSCTQQIQNGRRYSISGPPIYTMEISEFGIKLAESLGRKTAQGYMSAKKSQKQKFYHLDKVTFAGCHPKNDRIFGFISKDLPNTYHCHIFQSDLSAVSIARAIGEAFKMYYLRVQAQRHANTGQSQPITAAS